MKITLFSKKRIFSGANFLYTGLKKLGHEVTFCCIDDSCPYNYGINQVKVTVDPNRITDAIDNCDMLILSASATLEWIYAFHDVEVLRHKEVKIVIGDSHYCLNSEKFNDVFEEYNIDVHIMPDIMKYCTIECQPYYPPCIPFEITDYQTDKFTISHLPGIKYKSGIKGTRQIESIVKDIKGVKFVSCGTIGWQKAIEMKRRSNLYIDQMVEDSRFGDTYKGGLGKNGIEAMMIGTPVITSGTGTADMPMYWIDQKNLKETIERFIEDRELLEQYGAMQHKWALDNCRDTVVAQRVINNERI